ncbi:hypothetical protein FE697_015945 [Mumia zhuanghuii]|uniref:Tetratricopeptide repeat protein n=2 Tax=Mumia TaxID=1546255 RepID=A0ABW1QQP6_9ACTN|nr:MULTISPECIES: hypothetical protein [Mumia]KAA1420456.1 hypothetical protein FE697_015945 [Mumia zhuanghuii]
MTSTSDALTIAQHWLDVGNPQRCLDSLDETALELDPPYAFGLRALALLRLGRPEDGLAAARRGLEIAPGNGLLHFYAAQASDALKHAEEAERHYRIAQEQLPEAVGVVTQYGTFLAFAHRESEARSLLRRAREIAPEDPTVHLLDAEIAAQAKNWPRVQASARRVLAEDPEDTRALVLDAVAASKLGDHDTAARSVRRAAASRVGDQTLALAARQSAVAMLPAMWPLRLVSRFAWWQIWLAALITLRLIRATAPEPVWITATILWIAFVAYSWVLPPLLTAWVKRRMR